MWLRKVGNVWHVRFVDGNGKTVSRSTGKVSRQEAKRRAEDIVSGYLEGQSHALALIERSRENTVLLVADRFWREHLSQKKWAPTAGLHLGRIVKFLGPTKVYADVATTSVASQFASSLADQGLSPATINRAIAVFSSMHAFAAEVIAVPRIQSIVWKRVKRDEPTGRTRWLKKDELREILMRLPQHLQEVVIFAMTTGIRRRQVIDLTWDRVDMENCNCTIWLKARRARTPHRVELSDVAMKVLRVRHKATGGKSGERVFDSTNMEHLWQAAVKGSQIADVRFHDLRHTFASEITRVAGILVASKLLGHTKIGTTQRYAHVETDDLRKAVKKLPSAPVSIATKRRPRAERNPDGKGNDSQGRKNTAPKRGQAKAAVRDLGNLPGRKLRGGQDRAAPGRGRGARTRGLGEPAAVPMFPLPSGEDPAD